MLASVRRPSPAHRARRGERGVSIVLAMLVLFVILVVVFQVSYDANVEMDQAATTVETTRMRMMADAAVQQAQSSLLMDIENAKGQSDGGGGDMGMIPGGGGGNEEEQGGGEGEGGEEDPGAGSEVSDVIARTDSRLDDWQDSVSLQPPLGNDYTLWVEVEDEDSKINLLGLWSSDVAQREPQKEIVRNLLDKAFEGTSLDLSFTDATEYLDHLDDWVKGNRGSFDPVPKPTLKKTNAEEEAAGGETTDTSLLDESARNFPLTLGELLMIEGLRPEHLYGFIEDDTYHPGLESYLTVWSQLEIKPEPPKTDDPFSGSPFTQGSLFDKPGPASGGGSSSGGEDGEDTEGETPEEDTSVLPTNNGLVNINTATLPVLRAIAPDDIPTTFLERIIEFRENIGRLRTEGKLSGTKSLFDDSVSGTTSSSSSSDEDEGEGDAANTEKDDDDPTKYVFEKPEDVIPKVEEEYGIELKVEPDIETTFVGRLAVTSQVFTIKVLVRDTKTERRTSWSAVVWRQQAGEKTLLLPLIPLGPYYDARRLKDFPKDFAEQSQDRFQRWTDQGYKAP